jgi:hypothetical protein
MGPRDNSDIPRDDGVTDHATLYLCRQGPMWVVVIESPGVTGALRLDHAGKDPYDARFELLSRARRACPEAAIVSTDGALESADYEWRLEVEGVQAHEGDLGMALHHVLASTTHQPTHVRRRLRRLAVARDCHWGLTPFSGRPLRF